MTRCPWIVCERTTRWTAALRLALARDCADGVQVSRVYQVRSLTEVTASLHEQPTAVVLIELRPANLEEALELFASQASNRAKGGFVALLDDSDLDGQQRQMVVEAIRTAGAIDVVCSPRHLQHTLLIGRRIAELHDAAPAEARPLAEWAWRQLPWQEA